VYRILSIDGGGLLGTLPASFLAAIEEQTRQPIGAFFDLIAGTSTGGIIAIGLGMEMRASQWGHDGQLTPPGLSARSVFSEETFAGRYGNEKDAPEPAVRRGGRQVVNPTPFREIRLMKSSSLLSATWRIALLKKSALAAPVGDS
jgi:hypothetical protein